MHRFEVWVCSQRFCTNIHKYCFFQWKKKSHYIHIRTQIYMYMFFMSKYSTKSKKYKHTHLHTFMSIPPTNSKKIHTYLHTFIHTHIQSTPCQYTPKRRTYPHKHTHTHTYTHTYTQQKRGVYIHPKTDFPSQKTQTTQILHVALCRLRRT
jgi:hypothetical protein